MPKNKCVRNITTTADIIEALHKYWEIEFGLDNKYPFVFNKCVRLMILKELIRTEVYEENRTDIFKSTFRRVEGA